VGARWDGVDCDMVILLKWDMDIMEFERMWILVRIHRTWYFSIVIFFWC